MDERGMRVRLRLAAEEPKSEIFFNVDNYNSNNNKYLAPSVSNPNPKESIAAAALLLLFLSPRQLSLSSSSSSSSSSFSGSLALKEEVEEETSTSVSGSSSSCSYVSDACSAATPELAQIHGDALRILAVAADRASVRPKYLNVQQFVKKVRSKTQQKKRQIKEIYNMRVVYDLLNSKESKAVEGAGLAVLSLPSAPASSSAEAASSVTAVGSTTRRASSRYVSVKRDRNVSSSSSSTIARSKAGGNGGSKSVKRRADAIIEWLSGNGCASEVKIRSVVGDSPDTSKALRL